MSPDLRTIKILDWRKFGTEHTVTQEFLNSKAREFAHKLYLVKQDSDTLPTVCIAGYLDFLYLRVYYANYLDGSPRFEESSKLPEFFPNHFTARGILVIEALENETGYTFA